MMYEQAKKEQQELNHKYNLTWLKSPMNLKVGISRNVKDGLLPINGVRHKPEGDTTGWYIWAGENTYSEAPDFFEPLYVELFKCGRAAFGVSATPIPPRLLLRAWA